MNNIRIGDVYRKEEVDYIVMFADSNSVFLKEYNADDSEAKRVYESKDSFLKGYEFFARLPSDKYGTELTEGNWVLDPRGRISQVIEINADATIRNAFGEVYESNVLSLVDESKIMKKDELYNSGFRQKLTGKDRPKAYESINDAQVYHPGFEKGDTEVYFLRNNLKARWYEKNDPKSTEEINEDYCYVGSVQAVDFETLQSMFREDVMSPQGEAFKLFESLGFDRTELQPGDMLKISGNRFIVTKFGLKTIDESRIYQGSLVTDLKEAHSQDDSYYSSKTRVEPLNVGQQVMYGRLDAGDNMCWEGNGRIIKIDDDIYTVETEIGQKVEKKRNEIQALVVNPVNN